MARSGFVAVHEAGADRDLLRALQALDARNQLPIRVYAMLAQRDEAEMAEWKDRGVAQQNHDRQKVAPQATGERSRVALQVRSVKAFYDGALGSRGAQLLEDYS